MSMREYLDFVNNIVKQIEESTAIRPKDLPNRKFDQIIVAGMGG